MKSVLIALAAAGMLASTSGVAQTYHPDNPRWAKADRWDDRSVSVNEREARINARIQRGIDSGRVNDREARRLLRELREIEAKERAFKDDGRLSRRETESLNRDLDRLADNVRRQIRD